MLLIQKNELYYDSEVWILNLRAMFCLQMQGKMKKGKLQTLLMRCKGTCSGNILVWKFWTLKFPIPAQSSMKLLSSVPGSISVCSSWCIFTFFPLVWIPSPPSPLPRICEFSFPSTPLKFHHSHLAQASLTNSCPLRFLCSCVWADGASAESCPTCSQGFAPSAAALPSLFCSPFASLDDSPLQHRLCNLWGPVQKENAVPSFKGQEKKPFFLLPCLFVSYLMLRSSHCKDACWWTSADPRRGLGLTSHRSAQECVWFQPSPFSTAGLGRWGQGSRKQRICPGR